MENNYILPFLWMKGESQEVIREEIEKIDECGIKAICLESRPHPDFMGEKWWEDMAFIIEEAKKRNMKIWILDDAHFPSGQAAGKMADAPAELCKQYLNYALVDTCGPMKQAMINVGIMAKNYPNPFAAKHPFITPETRQFDDDQLFAVVASKLDGKPGDIYIPFAEFRLSGGGESGFLCPAQ